MSSLDEIMCSQLMHIKVLPTYVAEGQRVQHKLTWTTVKSKFGICITPESVLAYSKAIKALWK